jgi:fatty-acid peroxygenase
VFETRLLLEKTICMTGSEAAQIFTDKELFMRKGAAPEFIRATLFGKGGVQGLDDESHLHRKKMFMSFMTDENIQTLKSIMSEWMGVYAERWSRSQEVILYHEFQEILTRSVCTWVGVELSEKEVPERTKELSLLFDSAASATYHLRVRANRKKAEKWIGDLVEDIRKGKSKTYEGSPLQVISQFRDHDGKLLSKHVASVEILNLLRPTVAVSLYLVFSCHALHLHPQSRERLRANETSYLENFVNEVRRFYPFFPASVAKVRKGFLWNDFKFKKGKRVILDLYGINHDPRYWDQPLAFNPDRFKNRKMDPFTFIPQGVGDHHVDHRCPGEFITSELMKAMVTFFVNRIDYDVPSQNLMIDMTRLPAVPKSLMKISNVRSIKNYVEQFA